MRLGCCYFLNKLGPKTPNKVKETQHDYVMSVGNIYSKAQTVGMEVHPHKHGFLLIDEWLNFF